MSALTVEPPSNDGMRRCGRLAIRAKPDHRLHQIKLRLKAGQSGINKAVNLIKRNVRLKADVNHRLARRRPCQMESWGRHLAEFISGRAPDLDSTVSKLFVVFPDPHPNDRTRHFGLVNSVNS